MGKIQSEKVIRIIYYFIGVFIVALIYNAYFVPYNIVVGGVSGLAIIVKALTGLSTTIFINVTNVLLIIVSLIFLGKKGTLKHLLGCISYPLMITFTEPLAKIISFQFESTLLMLLVSSIIYGIATGIIYRAGYSTGGADIIIQILSIKLKKTITSISLIILSSIIICGGIVFSPVKIMYAITIIFISNKFTDFTLYSVNVNKLIYVISKKNQEIEDYIMNKIHTGATEINVHSGLLTTKKQMIMCVVHNTQYRKFRQNILQMDPNAFILAKDCYEVNGGRKYKILPF